MYINIIFKIYMTIFYILIIINTMVTSLICAYFHNERVIKNGQRFHLSFYVRPSPSSLWHYFSPKALENAMHHSGVSDLHVVLGSSLRVSPKSLPSCVALLCHRVCFTLLSQSTDQACSTAYPWSVG